MTVGVGGMGVTVGVFVGGRGVLVGVEVGSGGVAVGDTDVTVGDGLGLQPLIIRTRIDIVENSSGIFFNACPPRSGWVVLEPPQAQ